MARAVFQSVLRKGRQLSFGTSANAADDSPEPSSNLGLTVIHDGPEATVDIVFVHGLSGHPMRSWTSSNQKFWPRDFLPKDLPASRIMTFGYDADPDSARHLAKQILYYHAEDLMSSLERQRTSRESERRPLIFVCHSLGGLIVKSMLVMASGSNRLPGRPRNVYQSTCGIIYYGTPHRGSKPDAWRQAIQKAIALGPNGTQLSKPLQRDSDMLALRLEQYNSISADIPSVFFYECRGTDSLGSKSLIVPESVAVLRGSPQYRAIGLDANHLDMVKFREIYDGGYQHTIRELKAMLDASQSLLPSPVFRSHLGTSSRAKKVNDLTDKINLTLWPNIRGSTTLIGRSQDMSNLDQCLRNAYKISSERHHVIVAGKTGVGKSALVQQYLQKRRGEYTHVIWLDARSIRSIQRGFLELLKILLENYKAQLRDSELTTDAVMSYLGLEGILDESLHLREEYLSDSDDFAKHAVNEFLERKPKVKSQWVLVLDNHKATFDFRKFIPQTLNGQVILINRASKGTSNDYELFLEPLSYNDALELLALSCSSDYKRWTVDELNVAKTLVGECEYLPAEIQMKGFAVAASSKSLLDFAAQDVRLSRGTDTSVELFDQHFFTANLEPVTQLLVWCSFLSAKPIPGQLLYVGLKMVGEEDMPHSLDILLVKGLVFLVDRTYYMRLTPTLAGSLQEQLSSYEEKRHAIGMALRMVMTYVSKLKGNSQDDSQHTLDLEHAIYPHLAECLKYAEKLGPDVWSTANFKPHQLKLLGALCDDEGDYHYAEHILHRSFDKRKNEAVVPMAIDDKGLHSVTELIDIGFWLGSLLKILGRYEDVANVYERVIEIVPLLAELGQHNIRTFQKLCLMYTCQGQTAEARELYERILSRIEDLYGPNDLRTLEIVEKLAFNCKNSGLHEESELLFQRALLGVERQAGHSNPRMLRAYRALAEAHKEQGKYEESKEQLQLALDASEARLGIDHPKTLEIETDLAVSLSLLGNFDQADNMFNEVLGVEEKILGAKHPRYVRTLMCRANSYRLQGRIAEAKEEHLKVLGTTRENSDPNLLDSLDHAAQCYEIQDQSRMIKDLRHGLRRQRRDDISETDTNTDTLNSLG